MVNRKFSFWLKGKEELFRESRYDLGVSVKVKGLSYDSILFITRGGNIIGYSPDNMSDWGRHKVCRKESWRGRSYKVQDMERVQKGSRTNDVARTYRFGDIDSIIRSLCDLAC